jgi:hypothetical protein
VNCKCVFTPEFVLYLSIRKQLIQFYFKETSGLSRFDHLFKLIRLGSHVKTFNQNPEISENRESTVQTSPNTFKPRSNGQSKPSPEMKAEAEKRVFSLNIYNGPQTLPFLPSKASIDSIFSLSFVFVSFGSPFSHNHGQGSWPLL